MKPAIKGMTALVTGASSGMGYEYARQLAALGVHIIAVSNEEEKIHRISKELSAAFAVKTFPVFMDLARTDAAMELYEYCASQQLEVDILINNAGMFFYDDIVEVAPDKGKIITMLHMVTPSLLCTYFGKEMKQRKHGYILNMSSISAHMPYPGISYYASTKRYLKTFSRALRSELRDHKVSVSCVCPGAVATNLFDKEKIDYEKAIKWGIMMMPEKVVCIALRGLFKRKSVITPGFVNHVFVALVRITPQWLILALKRRKFMGL